LVTQRNEANKKIELRISLYWDETTNGKKPNYKILETNQKLLSKFIS